MKSKRRILLIDLKFQLTFLLYSAGLAVLGIIFNSLFQSFRSNGWEYLAAAIALCGFSLVLFMGLIVSNRMAGPIYRLRIHMNGIAAGGEIREVHFRDHDFFIEVGDAYNKVLLRMIRERSSDGK